MCRLLSLQCLGGFPAADLKAECSECRERAHTGRTDFVLRALAARMLLQRRKFLYRCAARKPVVHATRSENETLKDQVAGQCRRLLTQLLPLQHPFALASEEFLQRITTRQCGCSPTNSKSHHRPTNRRRCSKTMPSTVGTLQARPFRRR